MILNVMAFYNKKINCYTQPHFIDMEPEKAALQLSRTLTLTEDWKMIDQYKNLTLYYLGQFDDETGEFIQEEKRALLDCSLVVKNKAKKEGKKDVKPSIPTNRA